MILRVRGGRERTNKQTDKQTHPRINLLGLGGVAVWRVGGGRERGAN